MCSLIDQLSLSDNKTRTYAYEYSSAHLEYDAVSTPSLCNIQVHMYVLVSRETVRVCWSPKHSVIVLSDFEFLVLNHSLILSC